MRHQINTFSYQVKGKLFHFASLQQAIDHLKLNYQQLYANLLNINSYISRHVNYINLYDEKEFL